MIALHQVWEETDEDRARKAWPYWIGAANKQLNVWRRVAEDPSPDSFVRRELVRYPDAADVRLLLSVAHARDAGEVREIFGRLLPHYKANADSLYEFCRATTADQRRSALLKAEQRQASTEPLLIMLKKKVELLGDL